jgi:hypothetical protein
MLFKNIYALEIKTSNKVLIMKKRRTTICVDPKTRDEFMKYVIDKHGKTHGGVISDEVENAIKLLIRKESKR